MESTVHGEEILELKHKRTEQNRTEGVSVHSSAGPHRTTSFGQVDIRSESFWQEHNSCLSVTIAAAGVLLLRALKNLLIV